MLNHRSVTCGKCNGLFYVTLIVLLIYLSCCWQQKSTLNMIIHVGHIFYEYRTLSFIWKQSSNTQITYKADLSSTHLRNMTLKSVLICNNSRLPRKERKEASVSWHQRECMWAHFSRIDHGYTWYNIHHVDLFSGVELKSVSREGSHNAGNIPHNTISPTKHCYGFE